MRRLTFQHQNGLLSDAEIVEMAAPVKAELTQLEKQASACMPGLVVQAGEQVITIRYSWKSATKEQKRDMLHLMLKAVYVDTNERRIVEYEPQPEFTLLFQQTTMRQSEGLFIPAQGVETKINNK